MHTLGMHCIQRTHGAGGGHCLAAAASTAAWLACLGLQELGHLHLLLGRPQQALPFVAEQRLHILKPEVDAARNGLQARVHVWGRGGDRRRNRQSDFDRPVKPHCQRNDLH